METPIVQPKGKSKNRSKSKSKRSSPRRYDFGELPQYMQPLKLPHLGLPEQHARRPKAEIVRELRRLYALPVQPDDEEKEVSSPAANAISTLEQLDCLRLTRHRLEQLLHSANFELAVCNCFVRLNINAFNVPPEYRIAEILSVRELSEGYYVGKTPTNIVLRLRFEDIAGNYELNAISNMSFTLEEFELWRDNCLCQGIDLPNTDLIARKKVELYNALNSELKLSAMLQRKGLLPLMVPMRPEPRVGLLERVGGIYPWKLQPPEAATGRTDDHKAETSELQLEHIKKKLDTPETELHLDLGSFE